MAERKVRVRFAPGPRRALQSVVCVQLCIIIYLRVNTAETSFSVLKILTQPVRAGERKGVIFESFKWLGIHFDEGVGFRWRTRPVPWSERREIYKKYVQVLLDNDLRLHRF